MVAGWVQVRVRNVMPLSHFLEQLDQAVKSVQPPSIGHGCSMQVRVSEACGHATPPNWGATVARLRFCEPVPHDRVQVVQAPNAGTTQSTGQLWVLQAALLDVEPTHALPPKARPTQLRVRDWEPVPQDLSHLPKLPQEDQVPSIGHESRLQACFSARNGHT